MFVLVLWLFWFCVLVLTRFGYILYVLAPPWYMLAALTESNLEAHDFRLGYAAAIIKAFAGKRKFQSVELSQCMLDYLPTPNIALIIQYCVPGTQAALSATCKRTVYKVPLPAVVPKVLSYEWSCSECRYPRCAGDYCTDCGIPRELQDN